VHLEAADRSAYLAGLAAGADIDHRGTFFSEVLLAELIAAVRDVATGLPRIGRVQFNEATFSGDARFSRATFAKAADFRDVNFEGQAHFDDTRFLEVAQFGDTTWEKAASFGRATFHKEAEFDEAEFRGDAEFGQVTFEGSGWFGNAVFAQRAWFSAATFHQRAWFPETRFMNHAGFEETRFHQDARFGEAVFETASRIGPVLCTGSVDLSNVTFGRPVTVQAAARTVVCHRTRWNATATLHLRYANVDLTDAVLEYPLSIARHPVAFESAGFTVYESLLMGLPERVKLVSVRGADAAHLMVSNVDLSECRFAGTFHLDQLRMEGECLFAPAPAGFRRRGRRVRWWTARRVLAEEHHWEPVRADRPGPCLPSTAQVARGRKGRAGRRRLLLRRNGDAAPRPLASGRRTQPARPLLGLVRIRTARLPRAGLATRRDDRHRALDDGVGAPEGHP
jgi:uncharacterized protein YjbI with pentapeptide repeats